MPDDLAVGKILSMDDCFREEFGLPLIKPEAKIILLLKENKSLSVKEAMSFLDLSYRGFYILVKRMVENEIIIIEKDKSDHRVRRIFLKNQIICPD